MILLNGICEVTGYLYPPQWNIKNISHENTDYRYGDIELVYFLLRQKGEATGEGTSAHTRRKRPIA